ncbi:MAG: hypothetical protein V7744_08950 [Pseudomonadales bacterium]
MRDFTDFFMQDQFMFDETSEDIQQAAEALRAYADTEQNVLLSKWILENT